MTSLLRELTPEPMTGSLSTTTTSRPERAKARAIARPTTPAPITRHSTESMGRNPPAHSRPTNERPTSFAVGARVIQYPELERPRNGWRRMGPERPDELRPKLSY